LKSDFLTARVVEIYVFDFFKLKIWVNNFHFDFFFFTSHWAKYHLIKVLFHFIFFAGIGWYFNGIFFEIMWFLEKFKLFFTLYTFFFNFLGDNFNRVSTFIKNSIGRNKFNIFSIIIRVFRILIKIIIINFSHIIFILI
jgi:hypothetical protein